MPKEGMVIPQNRPPIEIHPEVLAFCRQLDPSQAPVWVPVRTAPGMVPGETFASLKGHVARHEGGIRFGWVIWENPGWFLEAEFHAVWVSPGGELLDLTPRPAGTTRLLFLPDSHRTFQGESIPNQFRALSPSPDVQAVVQSAEFHARLRADAETQARRARVAPGSAGRNDPCPCGSGLKYKKCCGRNIR
jgi:hypothetical protein